MASDGRRFFPLLGLSKVSHFQALPLKLKQKMRLSQLHSLIEPSVVRRRPGLGKRKKLEVTSRPQVIIESIGNAAKPRLVSEAFQTLLAVADMIFSLVEKVEFAAIVDKSYGIDRAERNPIRSLFERRKNCSSI